jgi:hypothetical protein
MLNFYQYLFDLKVSAKIDLLLKALPFFSLTPEGKRVRVRGD